MKIGARLANVLSRLQSPKLRNTRLSTLFDPTHLVLLLITPIWDIYRLYAHHWRGSSQLVAMRLHARLVSYV
jgi:hypothetical protein